MQKEYLFIGGQQNGIYHRFNGKKPLSPGYRVKWPKEDEPELGLNDINDIDFSTTFEIEEYMLINCISSDKEKRHSFKCFALMGSDKQEVKTALNTHFNYKVF